MGAGRSGSTILGVALGNCANVFFAGELDKWLPRSGEPKLRDARRTRFWSTVRERVADGERLFGGQVPKYLERSSALFRVHGWPMRRQLRAPYRRVMEELYRAVASTAGVTYLVDSSHYPLRARELQAVDGIDLYLVFLVREPRSVIASFARRDVAERRFSPLVTTAYLWLTHLLALWVFLRQPRERRLLLRHEDFLADPEGVLRCLLARAGAPASTPDLTALRTGIPLHGNRLVDSDVVALGRQEAASLRASRRGLLHWPWLVVCSALRPRAAAAARPRDNPSSGIAGASAPAWRADSSRAPAPGPALADEPPPGSVTRA